MRRAGAGVAPNHIIHITFPAGYGVGGPNKIPRRNQYKIVSDVNAACGAVVGAGGVVADVISRN